MGGGRRPGLAGLRAVVLAAAGLAAGVGTASSTPAARLGVSRGLTGASVGASARLVQARPARRRVPLDVPFREAAVPEAAAPLGRHAIAAARRGAAATLTLGVSFAGLNSSDGLAEPPDPQVAVGDGSVVEFVNTKIRVWTTSGAVKATYDAGPFFLSSSVDMSDPRVLFDPASGRWFAVMTDFTREAVKVAVSKTSDPTEGWWVYATPLSNCPDQPSLSVSSTLVVVGYNGFASCSDDADVLGGAFFVWNKAEVMTGGSGHYSYWNPSDIGPVTAVRESDPAEAIAPASNTSLTVFTFAGIPTASSAAEVSRLTVPIAALANPPHAVQQGGPNAVNTNDWRYTQAVASNGTIWGAANAPCIPPGDTNLHACLRLTHVEGTQVTERSIGVVGSDLYYPAIEPDPAGNLVVGYGFSSPSAYPSVAASVLATDGSLSPAVRVATGTAPHLGDRYGDHFGAARDPDNPESVWIVGEVGQAVLGKDRDWGTTIGRLDVAAGPPQPPPGPPPPPPPPPRDRTRPQVRALPSHGRAGHTARLLYRVWDNSGQARELITVAAAGRVLATIHVRFGFVVYGSQYSAGWHVPVHPPRSLAFCVQASDAAGNKSSKACARVSVR